MDLKNLPVVYFVILGLVSVTALATERVCPVCGEIYAAGTEVCPNDGTNLLLVETKKSEVQDELDAPEAKEDGETDSPEVEDDETGVVSGYKRHDLGGARHPAEQPESTGYSDRRSRIAKERRGPRADAERKRRKRVRERREFDEQDTQLTSEFERHREYLWSDRERTRLAEIRVREGVVAARKKLLNSLGAPLTSLGYRMFWMGESADAGPVSAAEIDLNLARYRLRAGFSTLIGIRSLDSRSELVFLESLSFGFQLPRRFSPYVVARGGIGVLTTERFGVDDFFLLTAVGAEVGVDSWITPWIAITPSVGYVRYMIDDLYWDSFTAKVAIGF
jgi:RNA polymerase subunit RPABC4/transcription elongation factor Spt4